MIYKNDGHEWVNNIFPIDKNYCKNCGIKHPTEFEIKFGQKKYFPIMWRIFPIYYAFVTPVKIPSCVEYKMQQALE